MFYLVKHNNPACLLDCESYLEKPSPLKDYLKIPPVFFQHFWDFVRRYFNIFSIQIYFVVKSEVQRPTYFLNVVPKFL